MAGTAYPPVGFHFKVEIQGFEGEVSFKSVGGLTGTIASTTSHQEGGENTYTHRFPDPITYGDLTLERGMLVGSALISWFDDAIQNFEFDPRNITVTLLTGEHTPLEQWVFRNAWPKAWEISSFDATSVNAVVTDKITLSYQYFYRVGLPARDQSLTPPTRV